MQSTRRIAWRPNKLKLGAGQMIPCKVLEGLDVAGPKPE